MESPLASWQVENFSTSAEFSPPISPSPQSPTLYSNAHHGDIDGSMYIKSEGGYCCSSPSSRAQLASRLLNHLELEDYHFSQYENQNEMRWTGEESINLELFEELEFDDFSMSGRPLTPDSQEFKNQERLERLDESPQPSPAEEFPSDNFDELSAEFQSILAGLSTQVKHIDNGEVIELLGVSCSLEQIQLINMTQPSDEADQSNNSGNDNSYDDNTTASEADNSMEMDDQHTFEDFELQLIGLNGNQTHQNVGYSSATSPSSSISEEEIDSADHTCENILDALLQGDLNTAKSYLPINMEMELVVAPSSTISQMTSSSPSPSTSKRGKRSLEPSVPKNGRGGSTGIKKPRLPSSTDKGLRKKEQNKTAATRYREKKKLQAAIVSIQEDALEKVNNELKSQRDDLHRQVLIYKELLREVMLHRKGKINSGTIGLGTGRHTATKRLIK